MTTDVNGRFHVDCSHFATTHSSAFQVIKLDSHALPEGYYLADQTPLVVYLTTHKVTKLNYGVRPFPLVAVNVSADAFEKDGTKLNVKALNGMRLLLKTLMHSPSQLRIVYHDSGSNRDLAHGRAEAFEEAVQLRWQKSNSPYRLPIEIRVITQ